MPNLEKKSQPSESMEDIILANQQFNEWCGTKDINYYEGIEALGFLFKYAVPKLKEILNYPQEAQGFPVERYKFHGLLQRWIYAIAIQGKDPALTLFWALWRAFKEDNGS